MLKESGGGFMLTPKQEKFVQNLVKGMSQREAYKNSYNATKMTDQSIDTKAYLLFKKVEVRSRYDELRAAIEDAEETRVIMSVLERKEWLTKLIKGEVREEATALRGEEVVRYKKAPSLGDKMKAMDILNKMDGEYKTVLDGSVEVKSKLEDLI